MLYEHLYEIRNNKLNIPQTPIYVSVCVCILSCSCMYINTLCESESKCPIRYLSILSLPRSMVSFLFSSFIPSQIPVPQYSNCRRSNSRCPMQRPDAVLYSQSSANKCPCGFGPLASFCLDIIIFHIVGPSSSPSRMIRGLPISIEPTGNNRDPVRSGDINCCIK